MSDKITIVTAFFPLGRENWDGRSDNKYCRFFEFWARINNDMVVYTDPVTAVEVEKIRIGKFGRSNTRIIAVDNFLELDPELLESLRKVAKNPYSCGFHRCRHSPESYIPEYNYTMLLKEWCVTDAISKGYTCGNTAWVDFGFNHGDEWYTDAEDFDFEWRYEVPDKMQLFAMNRLDDLPVFEIVRAMNDYIIGGFIVGPDSLWPEFARTVRENMLSLNRIGLMDDDQVILLMSLRQKPEMFDLRYAEWFEPLQLCTDHKFRTSGKIDRPGKLKMQFKSRLRAWQFARRWFWLIRKPH